MERVADLSIYHIEGGIILLLPGGVYLNLPYQERPESHGLPYPYTVGKGIVVQGGSPSQDYATDVVKAPGPKKRFCSQGVYSDRT